MRIAFRHETWTEEMHSERNTKNGLPRNLQKVDSSGPMDLSLASKEELRAPLEGNCRCSNFSDCRLQLTGDVPRKIFEMMEVEGLTRDHVASHLQELEKSRPLPILTSQSP
ncbi:chromatin modification-related protein EAF1 B-like protein isoform X1 [Tanacetum coccineum]